jgi:hypothetical protein
MLCVYAVKLLVCERAVATASSLYMCGYEQFDLRACVFSSFLCKVVVQGMCDQDGLDVTEAWKSVEALPFCSSYHPTPRDNTHATNQR